MKMNNQDRTVSALLDLIDRLEFDKHHLQNRIHKVGQELAAVRDSRNRFRNQLYKEWSDDLDGGAHRDMMEEFDA